MLSSVNLNEQVFETWLTLTLTARKVTLISVTLTGHYIATRLLNSVHYKRRKKEAL